MNNNTRWLVGTLITIVLLLSGWLYTGVQSRVDGLSSEARSHVERLASLEANYSAINGRLARIEASIDRVAEQMRRERSPER